MTTCVLLVADDDALGWMVRDYLVGVGVDTRMQTYASVQQELMAGFCADVVVVDVEGMSRSSIVAASRMRDVARAGIILLVPPMLKHERLLGLSLGVDHCMDKPVDLHELEIVIRNLIGRWHQRRAVRSQ